MTFESTLDALFVRGLGARFRASGHSMHPTIRCGEYLHVEACAADALRVGDVVLARHERGLTVHRIVRIAGPLFIVTRGDNALRSDRAIAVTNVIGRITAVERAGAAHRPESVPFPSLSRAAACLRLLRALVSQAVNRMEHATS